MAENLKKSDCTLLSSKGPRPLKISLPFAHSDTLWDFSELAAWYDAQRKRDYFKALDKDGNGLVSAEEYKGCISKDLPCSITGGSNGDSMDKMYDFDRDGEKILATT